MTGVWEEPKQHRATLIQAYSGFLGEMEPHLSQLLLMNGIGAKFKNQFIKWIMAEELWRCYLISVNEHSSQLDPYRRIYNELKNRLPFDLSQCFMHYILVPTFADRGFGVGIDVSNLGFFMRYYTHEIQPMARDIKHGTITNQEQPLYQYPERSSSY